MTEQEIKDKITAETERYVRIASDFFRHVFDIPEIRFNLRGTCGGQAINNKYRNLRVLRYNLVLAARDIDEFLGVIIPHEVAHYIVHYFYEFRCRPHGSEWKYVMQNVFNVKPERCHHIDATGCRARRTFVHIYRCACGQDLRVSTKHHKAIQANKIIWHKKCKMIVSRAWFKGTVDKYASV